MICYLIIHAYDGLGRRIQKDVNGVITKYIYDNEDILLEYDGTNTLRARWTHGPGIDEPLVMERDLSKSRTIETNFAISNPEAPTQQVAQRLLQKAL